MKLKILYLSLFLILAHTVSNAQSRRSGLGRGISDYGGTPNSSSKEPVDQVQAGTDQLTKELNLDGFQAAIVKNIIADYVKAVSNISAEQIPPQAKHDKISFEVTKMEDKVIEILNAKQKVMFQEIKDKKGKKGKKSKKKGADIAPE